MLRISYVIDSGKIKVSPYFHIKKCVDTTNMGGRTYPVRYYPVAIRLRDRKGRAILCIALFPQSGDSSGAILGVRSVALLHVIDSGKKGINFHSHWLHWLARILFVIRGNPCNPWEHRSYSTLRSPYTSIFSLKINFRSKRLYMCIFFCTFARFFVQVRAYMRINCMEVRWKSNTCS